MSTPLAIIAGIPLGVYRRSRKKLTRPGWQIRVIPGSHDRRADLRRVWTRVMNAADGAPAAGVHLLLAHDLEDERPKFVELKSRSHRATWLPRELSGRYGQPEFRTAVDEVLVFEECWRDRIRPYISSPLLLPETAFSAQHSVRDVWSRSRDVSRGRDSLDAVQNAILRFRDIHRQHGAWHDTNQVVFAHATTPHGSHGLLSWQDRKLTCHLPPGFHFDVAHFRRRRFQVYDRDGTIHRFSHYTNIDPHGFLRGGR